MKESSQQAAIICFREILWDILPNGPQPSEGTFKCASSSTKIR